MSAAFICSDFIRKVFAIVSLLALPAAAQQAGTTLTVAPIDGTPQPAAAGQNTSQPTPTPSAPEPKKLPQPTHVDYSKPAPLLPNPFARYKPRNVPPPVFTNGPKIRELVQNGKVILSLDDAIAIALTDNLDIAVARFNLPIADTDILRTKAGGFPLGVNAGVVQNTPGGGVGGIGTGVTGIGAGGTTAGAGGAGTGTGGIVGSTSGAGPAPDSFDPIVTGTLSFERANALQNFALLSGGAALANQNTTIGDLSYFQGFAPGTALTVSFINSRITSNNPGTSFNPAISSAFRATLRQHLLQGFGPSLNTRLIRQARNSKKITEEGFRQQVISTVSQIENIYWDLVNAYEDFKVKERSLALAQKTLSDNQKQVEIGTLAPLDVVRAQSTVASAEQDLIVSRTNLQLQQLTIKNALTRNLPNDAQVMQIDVIPSDIVQIPDQENLGTVEELIKLALTDRPDYHQQQINLLNSKINIQGANNGLLPVVDVQAFYQGSGLNGKQNPLGTCPNGVVPTPAHEIDPSGQIVPAISCNPPGTVPTTGFGDAFTNQFNSTAPDKGVAINISIPLGNRAAQATQVRSQLEYRQSQLALKSLENQISIQVRNDAFTVEQNRARVAAAQKAQVLAHQTLDAEQKKYNLGASTYLAVLQDERDLAQAESNLLSAKTNYAKSKVQLDRDTAQTLEHNNIKIDEAVTGEIRTQPAVPGIIQNKKAIEELTNPAPTPPAPKP